VVGAALGYYAGKAVKVGRDLVKRIGRVLTDDGALEDRKRPPTLLAGD
jgi:hypothetical protein